MTSQVPVHTSILKKTTTPRNDPIEIKSALKENNIDRERNGDCVHSNGYTPKPFDKKLQNEFYVGFSNLPNQVYQKAVRRGFEFNLMVVGETGLGKSTFINSLFLSDIYNSENRGPNFQSKRTTSVHSQTFLLKEQGVQLRLQLIDTPGFGDAVDNTNCWQPILDYINTRYDNYLRAERSVDRVLQKQIDQRVHALLYFFAPTGHTVKQLDLEVLRRMHGKVNIIPVIAKADTLTADECQQFKELIVKELAAHKIQTFDFPDPSDFIDRSNADELAKIKRLRERVPFAVVGANTLISSENGTRVRARSYPWGVVEVENMAHNDFTALRYLLLTVFMQELRDITHNILYESYRRAKLSGIVAESNLQTQDGKDPMAALEAERREHEAKMKRMEAEMEAVVEQKVQEKNQKLREVEAALVRRAEEAREQLRTQEQELEAARRAFEAERARWEESLRESEATGEINGTTPTSLSTANSVPLGDRVMSEVFRDKTKTDKKRKGLF